MGDDVDGRAQQQRRVGVRQVLTGVMLFEHDRQRIEGTLRRLGVAGRDAAGCPAATDRTNVQAAPSRSSCIRMRSGRIRRAAAINCSGWTLAIP